MVNILTNGSRTIKWWNRTKPYLDKVSISSTEDANFKSLYQAQIDGLEAGTGKLANSNEQLVRNLVTNSDIATATLAESALALYKNEVVTRQAGKVQFPNAHNSVQEIAPFTTSPNPATTIVNIRLTQQPTSPQTINIYNIQGQIVKTAKQTDIQHSINIADLANGIYYIQLANESYTQKLIVVK